MMDREAYDGATRLIARMGAAAAAAEAIDRAAESRRLDNPIRFASWCRVRRAILTIADPRPRGRLH